MTVMELINPLSGPHDVTIYEGEDFICRTRNNCAGINPYVNRQVIEWDFDCWGRQGSLKITIEKEAE